MPVGQESYLSQQTLARQWATKEKRKRRLGRKHGQIGTIPVLKFGFGNKLLSAIIAVRRLAMQCGFQCSPAAEAAETRLVSILREDVTQQLEEVSQDEKVAISRGSESEPGVNIIAKLFKASASSTGERSHHVAEALTPASLDHGVLESHFVDLFGGGDACQVCELPRKFLARDLQESAQAILARLKLNPGKFWNGLY